MYTETLRNGSRRPACNLTRAVGLSQTFRRAIYDLHHHHHHLKGHFVLGIVPRCNKSGGTRTVARYTWIFICVDRWRQVTQYVYWGVHMCRYMAPGYAIRVLGCSHVYIYGARLRNTCTGVFTCVDRWRQVTQYVYWGVHMCRQMA